MAHALPADYKSFLEQMEKSAGVKVPAHLWDKNNMVMEADDPTLSKSLVSSAHFLLLITFPSAALLLFFNYRRFS